MHAEALQTSLLLNPETPPPAQRTYVAFGTRRGGTSLVAGIMRALGLHLGDVGARSNNEDPAFQNRGTKQMRQAIEHADAEHDVWGWKFPAAAAYLPDLVGNLRNPHYVVVFRDPVAAALSANRLDREISKRPLAVALHESGTNANANLGFALSSGRPCLLVSNERSKDDPSSLIDEVADFLAVPHPDDALRARILAYVTPGSYKSFDAAFGDGGPGDSAARGLRHRLARRRPR